MPRISQRIATGFALTAALSLQAAVSAQEREPSPGPNWVFNGNGQKTDQPALVDMGVNDALFPININDNWGLMNQDGNIVVFPRYQWTDYMFDGYARIVSGGKTGYIRGDVQDDTNARDYFIPPRFDYADRFSNGCAVVMIDGRWGMIDKAGDVLLPLEFDGVLRMQDGFAGVEKGGLCGFINRAGDLKIPLQYKRVRSFHNGFAAVQLPNDRWGYIDKRGELVWLDDSGRIRMLGDFHESYARVKVEMRNGIERWGYLTKSFRVHVDPVYEDAHDFHNGLAAVKSEGKWGFISAAGRWQIEPQFDDADAFDDAERSNDFESGDRVRDQRRGRDLDTAGLYAMVKLDGVWGYVNRATNGGLVPQFRTAEPFFRGLARVDRAPSFAYVSEVGQVRFDPEVALRLGFVDRTGAERARLENLPRNSPDNSNTIVPAPPPSRPFESPYPPEHLYEETLPAPQR